MNTDPQQQLVWAAISGDIDSFGQLCKHYYASMVALGYSMLSDHHLAGDAAQEAFARALKNLNKLKTPGKFAPWLAQICRNVATDMRRDRTRCANAEHKRSVEASDAPGRGEPEDTGRDADALLVIDAIESLDPADRELIVLRYYNKMSYEQMAAVLGTSKPSINGRLTRTKRKLARLLHRQGILENAL